MDVEMDNSPSCFDPEVRPSREQFRRYGLRHSPLSLLPHHEISSSKLHESSMLYEGHAMHSLTNAALLLENIKQEAESFGTDHYEGTPASPSPSKRRSSIYSPGISEGDESYRHHGSQSLKACKQEDDSCSESGDSTFGLFASLLDSALQGLMPIPELILRFESSCRDISQSIRYGPNVRHRVVEDKLMRQKSQLLLDEAATWSLLWYLYGKGNTSRSLLVSAALLFWITFSMLCVTENPPEKLIMTPSTSHLEACQFVVNDHTAQLCLRTVQWLEGLASKAIDLENKVRGSHVGTYIPNSGVWHHTQRFLKRGASSSSNTVHHLDFDAPTREHTHQLPDDKKQDESLLEDVWILLRAGRLEEACQLCRSSGQPWRAATLCCFGGLDQSLSVAALTKNGKNRVLQAIELESGIGHQWRLWKWASFCASEKIAEQAGGRYEAAVYAAQCGNLKRMLPICTDWESACWAMTKSWLDVQADLELARTQPGAVEQIKSFAEGINGSGGYGSSNSPLGPENWPLQVMNQQPHHLSSLLQKLHSGEMVHEAVTQGCREQQRQIEMELMLGNVPHLLDLIWSWIAPLEDDQDVFRPHGDPQMIRCGAHLVLVLRRLFADEMTDLFIEKLTTVGDLILHMYAMFLFSNQHEELVGIYASQLAHHRCIDLFVHMMELRLNSSVYVKHKIFVSALEYLPFSPRDDSKGSFEEILERILLRSRDTKTEKYDKSADILEQHRLQSLQKAMVIQWLCFTPPSTIAAAKDVSTKLLLQALIHSNLLFREFSLISMWRVPAVPIGAHALLRYLAEPLKQCSESPTKENYVAENLKEFEDWREYYSCDATYRNWLKIELENAEVSPLDLSLEEEERAAGAAKQTLGSSLSLLLRKENPWLDFTEEQVYESVDDLFLELRATAMLCLPSGECLCPDPNLCAALMSALYSSVDEEVLPARQLVVNVNISSRDKFCIEVVIRGLAVEGDGLGSHEVGDGGLLAAVMASGFKGELVGFQAGVTMEISRLDAWYSSKDGSLEGSALYIVRGLCRRCCIPETILRCMQVIVSLIESGKPPENHDEFVELVACSENGFLHLFSQQQLQEFLLFEREYCVCKMELQEEHFS